MNKEELKTCVEKDSSQELLQAMGLEGFDAKVPGTPALFLNGKALESAAFLPVLEGVFEEISANH